MPLLHKTIFTGFAPNLTGRDTSTALSYLFLPWRWPKILNGQLAQKAEEKLKKYFGIKHAYAFDSGRSALYYGLKALGAGEGDDILVQAYTCVVVINAIKFTGAKPVYIDIGEDFNIEPADLAKKITAKTKILIIQHTFGLPAKLDEIIKIAREKNIKIIEDCAHSLGARYQGKLTGTFGDIGMLSFGSDKIISCVRGGALVTADQVLGQKIKKIQDNLPKPNLLKTIQHLLHYPIFYISKPTYHLYIGKFILISAKKLNVFNKIIYRQEKRGEPVEFYPAKLANSLVHILNLQIDEIDKINEHRKKIAEIYSHVIPAQARIQEGENIYLRYPILVDQPKKLLSYAKKHGIILGDWYNCVVAPCDIDKASTGYQTGMCPNAERLAARSVNLPTDRHIDEKQALKIIKIINSFNG